MWSSADTNAQEASDTIKDTRTRAQRQWDERSYAIAETVKKLRGATSDRLGWSTDAKTLAWVDEAISDLHREIRALVVDGYREGSPGPAMPTLKPITTPIVGQPDRIIPMLPLDAFAKADPQ